ncbi:MAG: hypothetical protein ACRDRD_12650, partial [Pseudonocardiaceae bacterium]
MMENLYRDEDTMAIVKELFSDFRGYLAAARDTLITGRRTRGRARNRTAAATGHALAFHTWLSLTREQGLDDLHAADLMRRLVTAAEDNSASSDPAARSPFVR